MARDWVNKLVYLFATALASLLFNLPLHLFKEGRAGLTGGTLVALLPVIAVACMEPFRNVASFRSFFAQRSFKGMLLRAFLLALAPFPCYLLNAAWPTLNTGGLLFGLAVGLLTPVTYATLDHPDVANKSYWTTFAIVAGTVFFLVSFTIGRSYRAAADGIFSALGYAGGLWLGLVLGNHVNKWIRALQPAFYILKRVGMVLTAFAVGYFTIILVFSTLFGALWRIQGAEAFTGLTTNPGLREFFYFSVVTGTTIGYGDIVPHSGFARCLAGGEAVASLAWTLIVFAALSVEFGTYAKENSQ